MLSYATNQPKSTVELGYMCPRGLLGQHSSSSWNMKRYFFLDVYTILNRQWSLAKQK